VDKALAAISQAALQSELAFGAPVAKARTDRRGGEPSKDLRSMPYGMYLSAAGAHVQSRRLQVLANNLANVATPGFKREFSVFQARNAEAIERGNVPPGTRSIDDVGGGVGFVETVTDFSGGTLQQTGNPTDFALRGDGFFLVEKDGQQLLTRAGNFLLSSDGRLITDQGYSVLSHERLPISVNPEAPWNLLARGVIQQAGTQIPLAVVQPQSTSELQKSGENLFSSSANLVDIAPAQRRVAQGYLEQSSVQPTLEMMELIETSRGYEANIRMIQHHDQLLSSLVNRVLRV
jgi:flagellar basal-body rod protein FlgF/flagellar basal-body rod protein FlgG